MSEVKLTKAEMRALEELAVFSGVIDDALRRGERAALDALLALGLCSYKPETANLYGEWSITPAGRALIAQQDAGGV